MKRVALAVALAGGVCVFPIPPSPAHAQEGHKFVTPSELTWVDAPALGTGVKLAVIEGPMDQALPFTVRLELPADHKIPAHWHPGIEHVTVISGTLNMGVGDKFDPAKTQALAVASVVI